MKSIVIGQYIPGTGFLYKIDPRTKLIGILLLLIAVFFLKTIPQLLIASAILVVVFLFAQLSLPRIIKGLKPILVLLIFTFIFQIFFNQTGQGLLAEERTVIHWTLISIPAVILWTVIWRVARKYIRFRFILLLLYIGGVYAILNLVSYGPTVFNPSTFQVYSNALEMSLFVIIRLLIVLSLSTILTLTTKPTDLTQGIERLMRPLKVIGVQSEDFALIISISLRYIPTILDEANKIMLAQASRGADFSEGKLKDKIKQVISLLVPMFIIAFKRSEDLADAMESRNFVPGRKRSRIHELAFGKWDIVMVVFVLLALTAAIMVSL